MVNHDKQYTQRLAHQRRRDLAKRQKPGIIFYPISWLLLSAIVLANEPSNSNITLTTSFFALFCIAALVRYIATQRYKKALSNQQQLSSMIMLNCSIAFSASSFGIVSAYSLVDINLQPYAILILAANFSLCAGGVIALCISRLTTFIFLCGMLLPSAIACLFFLNRLLLKALKH